MNNEQHRDDDTFQCLRVGGMGNLVGLLLLAPKLINSYEYSRYLIVVFVITEFALIIDKYYNEVICRRRYMGLRQWPATTLLSRGMAGSQLVYQIYFLNLLICFVWLGYGWTFTNYLCSLGFSLMILTTGF